MKYRVLDILEHNGKPYITGDEVEMTEADAKPLIAVRVLAPIPPPPKTPKKEDEKTS